MDLIMIGAGGHAKVVQDTLLESGMKLSGIVDDRLTSGVWRGVPYLGGSSELESLCLRYPDAHWFVAIGAAEVRRKFGERLNAAGARCATLVHPRAYVAGGVTLGEGTVVMAGATVQSDSKIGRHVIVNTGATVDHDNELDDYVHLSPGVHLAGNVTIGEASHIGIGASVVPGIRIGSDTVVGAGAVVIRHLPDAVVAVGCPAEIISRKVERHAE